MTVHLVRKYDFIWLTTYVDINGENIVKRYQRKHHGTINTERKGTGIKSVVLSALSAAFGVQKRANLERD
ncbi:DUF2970 domain-containing protein, partial [Endozoicomonas acroporae]|uniref:DUF2970 domain-containing protein n=1 Tax=Endozoicomonas acroporae TaxID=1701104 RepID=UPI0019D66BC7